MAALTSWFGPGLAKAFPLHRRENVRKLRVRTTCDGSSSAEEVYPYNVPYDEIVRKGRESNAFVDHCDCRVRGAKEGPLQGLTFSVKDMFHIASFPTGFGNPTWLETHPIPTKTAPSVQVLLDAGASVVSKTKMDELAFSLTGVNFHYGTPLNPEAQNRIPGGSSSGSASSVSSSLSSFSLGSDTAGSVRIPSSLCGILGMRPSHGRISVEGVLPLQPSFDTVGFFARDIFIFRDVGKVLLSNSRKLYRNEKNEKFRRITKWKVAKDAFEKLADPNIVTKIYESILPIRKELQIRLTGPESVTIGDFEGGFYNWVDKMRILQLAEVWKSHGEWVERERPQFGGDVGKRFEAAKTVDPREVKESKIVREKVSMHINSVVSNGTVLFVPATFGIPPLIDSSPEEFENFRKKTLCLTVIAGIGGLPQINLPVSKYEGFPVGLGIIGPKGWDEELLDFAVELTSLLQLSKNAEQKTKL